MEKKSTTPKELAAWLRGLYEGLEASARINADRIRQLAAEGDVAIARSTGCSSLEVYCRFELEVLSQRLENVIRTQEDLEPQSFGQVRQCLQRIRSSLGEPNRVSRLLFEGQRFVEAIDQAGKGARIAFARAGDALLNLADDLDELDRTSPFLGIYIDGTKVVRNGQQIDLAAKELELLLLLRSAGQAGLKRQVILRRLGYWTDGMDTDTREASANALHKLDVKQLTPKIKDLGVTICKAGGGIWRLAEIME